MTWRTRAPGRPGPAGLLFGVALAVLAGCDAGPKRLHLFGQVLYDGKPVPTGEIYFDPDVTKGKDGPQGFARIVNGRYDTRDGGVPLTAGPHVVRIFGFDGKARPEDDLPFGRRLFADFSTAADVPDRPDANLDFQVPARGQAP
jgi:hypothetical protein